ncbi:MAG TPA: YtxH domain-containing protein [Gemmatimonadales bacterium]|jgi:gas vesicle protein
MSFDTEDLDLDLEPDESIEEEMSPGGGSGGRGRSLSLALVALAIGAGVALLYAPTEGARAREFLGGELRDLRGDASKVLGRLQREVRRRRNQGRRQAQFAALAGLVIGAGLTALLTPASGPEARRRITERIHPADKNQSFGEATSEAGRNAEQVF